jgi:hypothetical protein
MYSQIVIKRSNQSMVNGLVSRETMMKSARADCEKNRVPMKALFRGNTLCMAKKRRYRGAVFPKAAEGNLIGVNLGYGIIDAALPFIKGMAAADAFQGQPAALEGAVFFDGLKRVL